MHDSVSTSRKSSHITKMGRVTSIFVTFLICGGFLGVEGLNCTTTSSACVCEGAGFAINIEKAFNYP